MTGKQKMIIAGLVIMELIAAADNTGVTVMVPTIANSFGIKGETVSRPSQISPAMKRAVVATRDGRPYVIDALLGQTGPGAGLNWHPDISIAAKRKRNV